MVNGSLVDLCMNETLHTPVLVWVSYFQKDDGQKAYKKHTNKDTQVSTQQDFFFVSLSVHAVGQTNTMKI